MQKHRLQILNNRILFAPQMQRFSKFIVYHVKLILLVEIFSGWQLQIANFKKFLINLLCLVGS